MPNGGMEYHGNVSNTVLSVSVESLSYKPLFHLRRRISFNDQHTYVHVFLLNAASKKRNNIIKHNINVQLSFLTHKAENVMTRLYRRYILIKYYINKCVIFFSHLMYWKTYLKISL